MRKLILILALLPMTLSAQTLEECQMAAERNYPLIRQYDLIRQTTDLTVSNARKGWLPQLSAQAQATWQNDVTAFPESMQALYRQAGITMEGLRRDQYRVGVDVQQTVYDGGAIRSQTAVAQRQGDVEAAQTAADLYKVRARVNEMYFALLLTDQRLRLNRDLQQLLEASERQLQSMVAHGTAAESDYLNVKAERLNVAQQLTDLEAQRQTVARVLTLFCGGPLPTSPEGGVIVPVMPQVEAPTLVPGEAEDTNLRPELRVFDARLQLATAQERALDAWLLPRLSVFATGFYGYPGYNMFEDMMHRRFSWNAMVGARLTWNIGALYTRKNDRARLGQQREQVEVGRDVFLFNSRLEQVQEDEDIARYRRLMADDEEIIRLRTAVRKAAESKLAHGIIDVNDLLRELNSENAARISQSVHEIEMLKAMYDRKYTTGL